MPRRIANIESALILSLQGPRKCLKNKKFDKFVAFKILKLNNIKKCFLIFIFILESLVCI